MDGSPEATETELTPTDSVKSSPEQFTMNVEISADDTPISLLPLELLSAIIDYVPKTQWSSLELVNRSFRDAVYSSWKSMKEFDIDKDVLGIQQRFKYFLVHESTRDLLPSILAKLLLRSPMVKSIIGFPLINDKTTVYFEGPDRSEIQHTIRQFTNPRFVNSESEFTNQFTYHLGRRGRLIELGLLHKYYCSNEVIEGISHYLAGLKSLHLFAQDCHPPTLVSMIKKMVNLEKLTINRGNDDWYGGRQGMYEQIPEWDDAITLEVVEAVATYVQNLRSFHMRWWFNIRCLHVLTRMERLEELSIVGLRCANYVESEFSHLRSLELEMFTSACEKFLAGFLKHTPRLRRLVFSRFCWHLPDTIPTTCPRLREFCLPPGSGHWKKEIVQAIIDGCLELEQLRC